MQYPKDKIRRIFALAPKFYFMQFEDGETLLKSKGIQMTLANSKRIHAEGLGLQLMETLYPFYKEGEEERRPFQVRAFLALRPACAARTNLF